MKDKERAAMQQALEALEELHYSSGTVVAARKYEIATAALREALANTRSSIRSTSEYSEQAEQEPVAWMAKNGEVCRHGWRKFHAREEDVDRFCTPLYAAPVRTKDLTDDEINKISNTIANAMPAHMTVEDWKRSFSRAVIAADREKNK